jgi:hypothetical protein
MMESNYYRSKIKAKISAVQATLFFSATCSKIFLWTACLAHNIDSTLPLVHAIAFVFT